MLRPSILAPSAAWLSRAPPHSGHGSNVATRSIAARMCGCAVSTSLDRKVRSKRLTSPSYFRFRPLISTLASGPRRNCSHSASEKSASFLSGSKWPDSAYIRHCQESTPKFGSVIAPSLSDRPRSTIASTSTVDTWPIPSHSRHIPCGSLKENRLEWPTYGLASRLKSSRSIEYASVAVPTVEREFAPMRS